MSPTPTQPRLQLEAIEDVERAFVHVDYARRKEPEHKVDRNLASGSKDLFTAHHSIHCGVRSQSSGIPAAAVGPEGAASSLPHSHSDGSLAAREVRVSLEEALARSPLAPAAAPVAPVAAGGSGRGTAGNPKGR